MPRPWRTPSRAPSRASSKAPRSKSPAPRRPSSNPGSHARICPSTTGRSVPACRTSVPPSVREHAPAAMASWLFPSTAKRTSTGASPPATSMPFTSPTLTPARITGEPSASSPASRTRALISLSHALTRGRRAATRASTRVDDECDMTATITMSAGSGRTNRKYRLNSVQIGVGFVSNTSRRVAASARWQRGLWSGAIRRR